MSILLLTLTMFHLDFLKL